MDDIEYLRNMPTKALISLQRRTQRSRDELSSYLTAIATVLRERRDRYPATCQEAGALCKGVCTVGGDGRILNPDCMDEHIAEVQAAIVATINTLGVTLLGLDFTPITSSPITDDEVAQILRSL